MSSVVSIIIPCYNSGEFLPDALESIKKSPNNEMFQVIIVNDGSTDNLTLALLDELDVQGYTIIHQVNKGPAAARNTGVLHANGKYLLFLDSDNKIRNSYIDRAISILDKNENINIVYGDPAFFGDTTESRFATYDFNMNTILLDNYIDMCVVMRRKDWEALGGLDEERKLIGFEDWELWIRAGAAGMAFYHIKEIMFDYRVRENSLVKQTLAPLKFKQMQDYVYLKHQQLLLNQFRKLNKKLVYFEQEHKTPLRSFLKYSYKKISKAKSIQFLKL